METPCSARSESPVNTPLTELDDHRNQPQSLPRTNTARTYSNTISPSSQQRPDLAVLFSEFGRSSSRSSSRSNEHAIVDDDDHLTPPSANIQESVNTPIERRGSLAPGRGRSDTTTTVRAVRMHPRKHSPSSSRSPSPPNSVEAFADPDRRRERSGTISSHAPTDLGLQLKRTISRRNTYDEGADAPKSAAASLAQEDVCFPMPEDNKHNGCMIDFEEMEEFIAERRGEEGRSSSERRRKTSSSSDFLRNNSYYATPAYLGGTKEANSRVLIDNTSTTDVNEKIKFDQCTRHPDRFSFFSSEMDATIHAPEIGDLLYEGETFKDLFRNGDGVWWLDCYNPTDAELRMLMKAFCVHPLTAEDIRVQETREKVELFKSYYFVCFRSFMQDRQSKEFMEPVNVYIIVFREGVLSFHFKPAPHSANVRRRIRQLRDYVALSADWICYALIDDITDSFGPVIHEIEMETDSIEDGVFTARENDQMLMLKQIGECRKKVMGLMRLLGGKADVIKGFAKRCNDQYSVTPRGEIGLYLGDIQDHIITMMGNLSHFEKMLSRSHSNYLAQLSVEAINTNNKANEVLGKITAIATILVPLNLICGLFGMNVPVPGQDSGELYWFFGILGVILAFVIASVYSAKKMKLM